MSDKFVFNIVENSLESNEMDLSQGDLLLINRCKQYPVFSFLASHFSRKIYLTLLEDCTINKIEVKTTGGNFRVIQHFLSGKKPQIPQNEAKFIFLVACELQIQSLADLVTPVLIEQFQNVFDVSLLNEAVSSKIDATELFNHMAYNISYYESEIEKLSDEALRLLITNTNFKHDPYSIKEIILRRVDIETNPNHPLVRCMDPIVFTSNLSKIFDNPLLNMNTLRSVLLKERLFEDPTPKSLLADSLLIHGDFSLIVDVLDGIIRAGLKPKITLSNECFKGYEAENMFTIDDSYMCMKTENGEGSFVLEFPQTIILKGFTLKSWKRGTNGVVPKTWRLEGSEDGQEYTMLYNGFKEKILIGDSKSVYFRVDADKPYKYFRFVQHDTWNEGKKVLAISSIEFFGYVE